MNASLTELLRELIAVHEGNVAAAARACNLSYSYVWNQISGTAAKNPKLSTLNRVRAALGLPALHMHAPPAAGSVVGESQPQLLSPESRAFLTWYLAAPASEQEIVHSLARGRGMPCETAAMRYPLPSGNERAFP